MWQTSTTMSKSGLTKSNQEGVFSLSFFLFARMVKNGNCAGPWRMPGPKFILYHTFTNLSRGFCKKSCTKIFPKTRDFLCKMTNANFKKPIDKSPLL